MSCLPGSASLCKCESQQLTSQPLNLMTLFLHPWVYRDTAIPFAPQTFHLTHLKGDSCHHILSSVIIAWSCSGDPRSGRANKAGLPAEISVYLPEWKWCSLIKQYERLGIFSEMMWKRNHSSCSDAGGRSDSFSTHLSADKEITGDICVFYKIDILLFTDSRQWGDSRFSPLSNQDGFELTTQIYLSRLTRPWISPFCAAFRSHRPWVLLLQ